MSRFGIALILTIILSLLVYQVFSDSETVKTANSIISNKYYDDKFRKHIKLIAEIAVRNTSHIGKISINKPYDKNNVNIYVFNSSKHGKFFREKNLTFVIAYAGENIVFIDMDFIAFFLKKYFESSLKKQARFPGLGKSWTLAQIGQLRRSLLVWIVGHELGHLVYGHAPPHFNGRALTDCGLVDELSHKTELQADKFVVKKFRNSKNELQLGYRLRLFFSLTMYEIIAASGIEKKHIHHLYVLPWISDEGILEYANLITHPAYEIRLLRMLKAFKTGVFLKRVIRIENALKEKSVQCKNR